MCVFDQSINDYVCFVASVSVNRLALDERSSSDEENENYGRIMFTPDDEDIQNVGVPSEFYFRRLHEHVDANLSENSDSSSDESDEYYNHSDYDEKLSMGSNKSLSSNAESANTTHSYSNSLLEDEEENHDDVSDSDFETDDQYEDAHLLLPNVKTDQIPDLSDLNNGTFET